jgi:hypothetical protein
MYEFEVVLMEKVFGRVTIKADGPEQAKQIALTSPDIQWDDPTEAEVLFVSRGD